MSHTPRDRDNKSVGSVAVLYMQHNIYYIKSKRSLSLSLNTVVYIIHTKALIIHTKLSLLAASETPSRTGTCYPRSRTRLVWRNILDRNTAGPGSDDPRGDGP